MYTVAVIDMGTNTFHLLIAKVGEAQHEVLLDEKHAVGLGRGGINDGLITIEAMDRALISLHSLKKTTIAYGVDKVILTGTSAVRSAKNKAKFIVRIKHELDWDVVVLTGDQEALGIYEGVKSAVQIPQENALIIDIGGGSVEFIICRAEEGILWKRSFEIGGQRLLERFQASDLITEDEIKNINEYLNEALKPLLVAASELKGVKTLIGSSGSFDTLCDMYCAEHGMVLKGASGFNLPLSAYRKMAKSLIEKNRAARLEVPGMIALRVEMIVVALVLINWVIEKLQIEKIEVSFYALKEGLLQQAVSS